MTCSNMKYANPIIPGFYPDQNIIRVDDDNFYLITSSFEYFPAIPIFNSGDLVNWKQIGHVLTRPTQVDNYGFKTEIIVSSIRNILHVEQVAIAGAHIATIPGSFLPSFFMETSINGYRY